MAPFDAAEKARGDVSGEIEAVQNKSMSISSSNWLSCTIGHNSALQQVIMEALSVFGKHRVLPWMCGAPTALYVVLSFLPSS